MSNEEYVSSRSIFNLVGLDEADFSECVTICLPKFAWSVARTFIYDYGKRKTSFSVDYGASTYETPDDVLWDKIDASLAEALGGCGMTCSEIVSAIEAVAVSVSSKGGCGCQEGSFGSGSSDSEPETFVDDGSTTFPPLYPDRPTYVDNKCGIARGVIDVILVDLLWLEAVNIGTISITAFVAALLTPIPGDELLAFVGMILSLFLQGILVATIQAIRAAINANLEDLICAIMNSDTSANAQSLFLTELGLGGVQNAVITALITNDSFNGLFQYGPLKSGFAPCNCDDCGCGIETNMGSTSDQITWNSEDMGWAWGVSVWVNHDGGTDPCVDTCDVETTFIVDSLTGWTQATATASFQINHYPANCNTAVNKYSQHTQWPDSETGRNFQVFSDTQFTLERRC